MPPLRDSDSAWSKEDVKPMKSQENLIQMLKEKAEAVQTRVFEVRSLQEALRHAVEVTREEGGAAVAAPGLDEVSMRQLSELCGENQLTLLTENLRDHLEEMHTGLTVADWGIAETATLVQSSGSEDLRIATMLSEIHVAALPRSRIVADSTALEEELSRLMQAPGGYLAFISGASRTADIERVLTIGVHGPQELHLLILDEEPA
jgi:L-lactate dehydrogenase complex protein LldG